jgi:hypothetical protein
MSLGIENGGEKVKGGKGSGRERTINYDHDIHSSRLSRTLGFSGLPIDKVNFRGSFLRQAALRGH